MKYPVAIPHITHVRMRKPSSVEDATGKEKSGEGFARDRHMNQRTEVMNTRRDLEIASEVEFPVRRWRNIGIPGQCNCGQS